MVSDIEILTSSDVPGPSDFLMVKLPEVALIGSEFCSIIVLVLRSPFSVISAYSAHLKGTLFAQINSLFLSHSFVKIFNLHLNSFNTERI